MTGRIARIAVGFAVAAGCAPSTRHLALPAPTAALQSDSMTAAAVHLVSDSAAPLAHLEELRARALGDRIRTQRIWAKVDAPPPLGSWEARGAVAISPEPMPRLRMILVGPAGVSLLDIWIGGGRFRLHAPLVPFTRVGEIEHDTEHEGGELRGLPIQFLDAWLIHPFAGELLGAAPLASRCPPATATRPEMSTAWTLWLASRRGRLRVDSDPACASIRLLREDASPTSARQTARAVEVIEADIPGCGHAIYQNERLRLRVEIRCESISLGANPAAFEPPTSMIWVDAVRDVVMADDGLRGGG